eukprot:Opistho-2@58396
MGAILISLLLPILSTLLGYSLGVRQTYIWIVNCFLKYSARLQSDRNPDAPQARAPVPTTPANGSTPLRRRISALNITASPPRDAANTSAAGIGSSSAVFTRPALPRNVSFRTLRQEFHLSDACSFLTDGVAAIVDDEVTRCFSSEELPAWNMLFRTGANLDIGDIPKRVFPAYVLGFMLRYFFFFPIRLMSGLTGVAFFIWSFSIIAMMKPSRLRKFLEVRCSYLTARMFVLSWSAVIKYHDVQNRARGGICVANHTSPIDCIVLANDNCYSMVGQKHGGFIGLLQKTLSIAQTHVWFERSEARDRSIVAKRLKDHVSNPDNNPVLIFPEGTCINNTSVMMFKKGSFEIGATVYPVAIKYHPKFGNCFWDSAHQSFLGHVFSLMTSWAVVCDVWYLPPMEQEEGESPVDFANRVKAAIARKGGLVDVQWDGMLKRQRVRPDFVEEVQREYSSQLLSVG